MLGTEIGRDLTHEDLLTRARRRGLRGRRARRPQARRIRGRSTRTPPPVSSPGTTATPTCPLTPSRSTRSASSWSAWATSRSTSRASCSADPKTLGGDDDRPARTGCAAPEPRPRGRAARPRGPRRASYTRNERLGLRRDACYRGRRGRHHVSRARHNVVFRYDTVPDRLTETGVHTSDGRLHRDGPGAPRDRQPRRTRSRPAVRRDLRHGPQRPRPRGRPPRRVRRRAGPSAVRPAASAPTDRVRRRPSASSSRTPGQASLPERDRPMKRVLALVGR